MTNKTKQKLFEFLVMDSKMFQGFFSRWTVRCGTLVSIIQHYKKLEELWKWYLKQYKDGKTKAHITGVQTQISCKRGSHVQQLYFKNCTLYCYSIYKELHKFTLHNFY